MQELFYGAGTVLIVMIIGHMLCFAGKDDTDRAERSGMILYTDYGTGCQYVSTILGGITPRLDKDGKPVCVKKD